MGPLDENPSVQQGLSKTMTRVPDIFNKITDLFIYPKIPADLRQRQKPARLFC